jgi:hypothetical protein
LNTSIIAFILIKNNYFLYKELLFFIFFPCGATTIKAEKDKDKDKGREELYKH